MNDILIKKGFPPIFIKDTDRINYFKHFDNSSSINLDQMLNFFADQLIESLLSKKIFLSASKEKNKLSKKLCSTKTLF